MTQIRRMMLEELQHWNCSTETIRQFLLVAPQLAKHFGKRPDQFGPINLDLLGVPAVQAQAGCGESGCQGRDAQVFLPASAQATPVPSRLTLSQGSPRLPTVLGLKEVTRLINAARDLLRRGPLGTLDHAIMEGVSFCKALCSH
jgi:hypothetical protein